MHSNHKDRNQALISISSLDEDQYNTLKQYFITHHAEQNYHTLTQHQLQQRIAQTDAKDPVGGGFFMKTVNNAIRNALPRHWYNTAHSLWHHLRHSKKYKGQAVDYAYLSKQMYKPPHERDSEVRGWRYNGAESDDHFGVYENDQGQQVMAVRGTKQRKDLLPDVHIAAGTQKYSKFFNDAEQKYRKLKNPVAVVGHSLGGSTAMYVAQRNGGNSYAFNPGYSPQDSFYNLGYNKHNIYVTKGDPVSNSILLRANQDNITVLPTHTINPIKSHSIDNFLH